MGRVLGVLVLVLVLWVGVGVAVPVQVAPKGNCGSKWGDGTQVAVTQGADGRLKVDKRAVPGSPMDEEELAIGAFNDTIATIGWATLEIHTNPSASDEAQMQAAGFLEGYLTAQRIFQHATNTGVLKPNPTRKLVAFLDDNRTWMNSNVANSSSSDPYWWQVHLVLTQLDSLYDGYAAVACNEQASLTKTSMLFLNLVGDIDDLNVALSGDDARMRDPFSMRRRSSAIVMPTDFNEDLLVAQTTWSSVESMMRIFKLYDFALRATPSSPSLVSAQRMSFSSYPGSLSSGDDFFVLSSGLVMQQTAIGNYNPTLYQYVAPACVLGWIRNLVTNRLAPSSREWGGIFNRYNSGTNNNMNMVVDMNVFQPGDDIDQDVLWMCEQLPGHLKCRDMSITLDRSRYFASYNIAYDPTIRSLSGVDNNQEKFGDWFDFHKHPRAQIFQREMPKAQSVDALKHVMRYNDFTKDPLSSQLDSCKFVGQANCTPAYSADNAIACRSDLNPKDGVYAFPSLGHRNHVATDAKITAFSMFNKLSLPAVAISGPTNDQQPTFVFSKSDFASVSHVGLPDAWDFPWVTFSWAR